ncbi:MAG: protein phosphatase 2C domain-containing protein [Saprospiraceae bacterium]
MEKIKIAKNTNKTEHHTHPRNIPNQDCQVSFFNGFNHVSIIVDGMGGHEGGHIAMKVIKNALSKELRSINLNQSSAEIVQEISRVVNNVQQEVVVKVPEYGGAAVTFAIIQTDGTLIIASMGDTRAYIISEYGKVQPATIDNISGYFVTSLAQVKKLRGKDAFALDSLVKEPDSEILDVKFDRRNIVKNVFMAHPSNIIEPGITILKTRKGDSILLTTDGVHDNLTTREIGIALKKGGVRELVLTALERSKDSLHIRSKKDDITASLHNILIQKVKLGS